jgi:hypothetical protein
MGSQQPLSIVSKNGMDKHQTNSGKSLIYMPVNSAALLTKHMKSGKEKGRFMR